MNHPCECGHAYEDHAKYKNLSMYCKLCPEQDDWCYNYRAIKNLAWLEWLIR